MADAPLMRCWKAARPGNFESTLRLAQTPRPSGPLRPGQILVRILRASLNPADYKALNLGILSRAIVGFPKTPGMDLCGRVVEVAKPVPSASSSDSDDSNPGVSIGDAIMARADPLSCSGSLSEYVVLDHGCYVPLPAGFTDYDAAGGAPTAALTAYLTIAPYVRPGAGDAVFLNGSSGGVGLFGIQIAKALGCHVTVTCSPAKADLCRRMGADTIIDYQAAAASPSSSSASVVGQLAAKGPVYRLAVDNVGNSPPDLYAQSHRFLARSGSQFVFVGGAVSLASAWSLAHSLLLPAFLGGGQRPFSSFLTPNDRLAYEQVAEWLADGTIRTIVDSTYDFEDVPQAFAHLKKGSCAGKVVIRVHDE